MVSKILSCSSRQESRIYLVLSFLKLQNKEWRAQDFFLLSFPFLKITA